MRSGGALGAVSDASGAVTPVLPCGRNRVGPSLVAVRDDPRLGSCAGPDEQAAQA